jgi:hypothetical protein
MVAGTGGMSDGASGMDGAGMMSGGAGGSSGSGAGGMGSAPPAPGDCAPSAGPKMSRLPESAIEQVAMPQHQVHDLKVHEGQLYFIEDTIGVQRIAAAGGEPEVLVPFAAPGFFRVEGGFIYYGAQPNSTELLPIFRVPLAMPDAQPEEIGATRREGLLDIADGYIYGFDRAARELWRQEFTSGTVEVLLAGVEDVPAADVADGVVYYANNSFGVENVFSLPVTGGTPSRLSVGSHFALASLEVIGDHIYWADNNAMYVTDRTATDPKDSTVRLGGYGPAAFGNRSARDFMERGDRVYWVDDEGTVGWTSADRTQCGAVITTSVAELLALGPDHVYVEQALHGIWRTAL